VIYFILPEMKLNPRVLGPKNSKLRLVFEIFLAKKRFFMKNIFFMKFDRKGIGSEELKSEICF
jgi:hypothetical protein